MKSKNIPLNQKLYKQVVKEAKEKFLVWPSAYASGWVVHTYKKRGGTYESSVAKKDSNPLQRWYQENWVNVCDYVKTGTLRPCGRSRAHWDHYPYCRPEKRITSHTPTTLYELLKQQGISELKERCRRKQEHPEQKVKSR